MTLPIRAILIAAIVGVAAPAAAQPKIQWDAWVPQPDGLYHATKSKASRGELVLDYAGTVPKSSTADKVWRDWRAAIEKAGWKLVKQHSNKTWVIRSASFDSKASKRRLYVLFYAGPTSYSGMWRELKAPSSTFKAPGKCVPVPEVRFTVESTLRADLRGRRGDPFKSWTDAVFTQFHVDLDGDGRLDALVPSRNGVNCTHDVVYTAYVMRGNCGHNVGQIKGAQISPETHRASPLASGLKRVITTGKITRRKHVPGPGQEQRGETTHFTWTSTYSKGRYQSRESTRTSCCCIHCSVTSRCNGVR